MSLSQKQNMMRVLNHQTPEWVPNGLEAIVHIMSPVTHRPNTATTDAYQVSWSLEADAHGGTYPTHDGHTIRDLHKWREQLFIPNVDDFDWSIVASQAHKVDRDEYYVRGFMEMGLFERSYLLLGMEEALVSYLTEPELMSELIAALADARIAELQRFDDECDLDMLWYGDDWGTQTNLFIPADTWRKIIKPHTQRIYDAMKQRGILIWQHSCGKIDDIFGDMVEMGAQVWDPCQPCNDLAKLKRQYGQHITFCGGIDSQAVLDKPGVTTDEVRAEVRLRIDQMADHGGYIAGPSHCVPYDADLLNAMNTEIQTYGRSVYAE